jgi:hypothetical protein
VACAALGPTTAHALEPRSTNFVDGVTLILPSAYTNQEETAAMGLEDCEIAVANESSVVARFGTTVDTTEENVVTGRTFFDSVQYFAVDDSVNSIDCETSDECIEIDDVNITQTQNSVEAELPFTTLTDLEDQQDCADGVDMEYFIRLQLFETQQEGANLKIADAKIILDTIAPEAPTSFSAFATDSKISATWEPPESDDDIDTYAIVWSEESFEGGGVVGDKSSRLITDSGGNNAGEVNTALEPGATIYVSVATVDKAGNRSLVPAPVAVEVVETEDFWEYYKNQGGAEEGGLCATTSLAGRPGGGPLGPAAVLALFLGGLFVCRRRRRSRDARRGGSIGAALLAASLVTVVGAGAAHAQGQEQQSEVYGELELKLGTYYPAIDSEFESATPFADIFGTSNLLYGELEWDFYLYNRFGHAGVGLHAGYVRVKGDVVVDDESIEDPGDTTFRVIPLRASGVYEFDVLAERWMVPLVPTFKAGLDLYLWRIRGGGGDTARGPEGQPGSGGTFGWHASFGLKFLLDIIDRQSAAAFDMSWGVNNSYLFAEYMITRIDDFGSDQSFDLSDNQLLFGLAFQF